VVGRDRPAHHADRRMLVTTADLCRRLPSLRAAMCAGEVSWAQVRTIVCQVQGWPRELDDEVDGAIAQAVQAAAGDRPDALGRVLRWGRDRLRPQTVERPPIERSRWVLQPALDGSGGRSYGEHTAVVFAVLETATRPGPPDRPTATASPTPATTTGAVRSASSSANGVPPGSPTSAPAVARQAPCGGDGVGTRLRVRAELDTLLGHDGLPAPLLHGLAGGCTWMRPPPGGWPTPAPTPAWCS
jgi:hypothetical protein